MTQLQNARLMHRAIKERWDIPEQVKRDTINELHIIATKGKEESSRIAACRAIILAEGQNQRDQVSGVNDFAVKVIELATRFGIDTGHGGGSASTAAGAIGSDAGAARPEAERA